MARWEFYVVMTRAMDRLESMYRTDIWSAQVADVSCAVFAGTASEVARQAVLVVGSIRREPEQGCALPLAPGHNHGGGHEGGGRGRGRG